MKFKHKQDFNLPQLETTEIDGRRHYITPDGLYPSITNCLSVLSDKDIAAWKARVGEKEANKISTRASRRGTNCHQMCEDYVNNELDEKKFLPMERKMFKDIKPILDENIGLVYGQELAMWSKTIKTAGRCDLIAYWDKELAIIDYKTAKRPKKREWILAYFQQCAAYAVMLMERTGIPAKKMVIVIMVHGLDGATYKPQVFVENVNDHLGPLKETLNMYYNQVRTLDVS